MTYDVFISYEHTVKSIADNIAASLEKEKIRCWYAPRNVIGDYATSIVTAIENSKVFIAIISGTSPESAHVLNEIEIAYDKFMANNISIIPFKVDDRDLSYAMEYYLKRLHWIDAVNTTLENAISDLSAKVKIILGSKDEDNKKQKIRDRSKYFYQLNEDTRLEQQFNLLKIFDSDLYDDIRKEYKSYNVLDLGSGNGKDIINKFGNDINFHFLIGIDSETNQVEIANETYSRDNIKFFSFDVEEQNFDNYLSSLMKNIGIDSFEIINISMLLLHLKNPHKLLVIARKYLSRNGKIIIRDIDDGLNLAYPDENNDFDRVYEICNRNETTGVRKNGRQIPVFLMRAGYKNINLARTGLNTLNMDFDEREALFNIYIKLTYRDISWMHEKYPEDETITKDFLWFNENYDQLMEKFLSNEFFFSLGFMTFIATK